MHYDLARLIVRSALKLDPHPPVALIVSAVASSDDRIGEGEKAGVIAALSAESFHVEIEFPVKHGLQATARDISLGTTVDRVAYFHVVGRHALSDCPSRA